MKIKNAFRKSVVKFATFKKKGIDTTVTLFNIFT
jgi:hypothetical protein